MVNIVKIGYNLSNFFVNNFDNTDLKKKEAKMKGTAAILLFVTVFISGYTYALTEAEVHQDFINAATTAVTVYKENGMSGLVEKTQSCYDNANDNAFYCFYFDLAARHLDQLTLAGAVQQGMNLPKTPFFDDDLFGSRAALLFQKANMDMKTSNDYLNSVTPVINKLVEDNLQTASQAPLLNKKELPETQSQTGNQSNTANVVGTTAGEQIPATAQNESQQSSNERKKEIAKYVIITLLLISLISVILHFNGKLVLYKDYTDAAVTVSGILGSVLLLFFCTLFLGLTPRTTWIVVLSFFIPISVFVFRMTYITNSNIFFVTLSLLTKYTTTFIYAFLMASLMFSGSSRRKGESQAAFEARRRRDEREKQAWMAALTAFFVWFIHATTKIRAWSPIENYFAFRFQKIDVNEELAAANQQEI